MGLRTGLMQLVRSRIQGSYVLCEVRSQRAELLQKTITLSKNAAHGLKIHRRFIANC